MKNIIIFTAMLLLSASVTFSQSVMDFQTGTTVVVQPGADICADDVIINGAFSGGGTICGSTVFTLNLTALIEGFYKPVSNIMIGDTIVVYLRKDISPYPVMDSYQSILNTTGAGTFLFTNVVNDVNYFIVIKHRNSIETWSINALPFSAGIMIYDFTPSANKAYGDNMILVDSSPIEFAIYSGDVNQNGTVDVTDLGLVDNDAFNFVTGYVPTDVTGNNVTDASDLAIVDNNAFNFVGKVTPP